MSQAAQDQDTRNTPSASMSDTAGQAAPDEKDKAASEHVEDYEKRYKDLQATFTKTSQEKKELERRLAELESTLHEVLPALAGQGQDTDPDADMPVSKKELQAIRRELRQSLAQIQVLNKFEREYPDLVPHEDLVAYFLERQTDARMALPKRLEEAAEMTRRFIEQQRQEAIAKYEESLKAKQQKQAEAGGLESSPPGPPKAPPEPEDAEAYLRRLQEKQAKRLGLI